MQNLNTKEQNTLMFLFDQSSGHCAYADNALIAHKINVSDGGNSLYKRHSMEWETLKASYCRRNPQIFTRREKC